MKADPASFRDPDGFVFSHRGRVFRAVRPDAFHVLRDFFLCPIGRSLCQSGRLVTTNVVTEKSLQKSLRKILPNQSHFFEHSKIPLITYPYEWTASMLRDAALLTLDIQRELIQSAHTLKDASAYNVQFFHGNPVFIDVLSVVQNTRPAVWSAYGQFCRHFLFPLLLKKHRHFDTKGYFLANLDGLGVAEIYSMLCWHKRFAPDFFIDVFLQKVAREFVLRNKMLREENLSRFWREPSSSGPQLLNLRRIAAKIRALSFPPERSSSWHDYDAVKDEKYPGEREKRLYLQAFLDRKRPRTILDVGCNTGRYSLQAARSGAHVVAVDSDHDSIDRLYQTVRREKVAVTCLWMDIMNPSPGVGAGGRERAPFAERICPDAVFALSIVHHLLTGRRTTPEALCDTFWRLSRRHLVLEYVPPDDELFASLATLPAVNLLPGKQDGFVRMFSRRFRLVDRFPLPGTKRALMTFQKK